MQEVVQVLSQYETIGTVISVIIIAAIVVAKVYPFWKKTAKEMPSVDERINTTTPSEALESLEVISETYVAIIKNLRQEVDRLKEDVQKLEVLRLENDRCAAEIAALKEENAALRAANDKQEKQIASLTRKVNRLMGKNK